MTEILILSRDDVAHALAMAEAIEVMADAFRAISNRTALNPVRTRLSIAQGPGDALVMPVYLPDCGQIGVKVVTVFSENPARGLPLIQGLVMVFDATHGRPLALMDGERLTTLRTGAASGLATRLLAKEGARCVAIFGAGIQGIGQLEAVRAVRPIERVLLFSTNPAKSAQFAAACEAIGLAIQINPPGRNLREADIICTATSSPRPVFADDQVGEGVHLNAIGAYRPDQREIPGPTVARARLVVDQREACLAEAGDLLLPMSAGLLAPNSPVVELGEILDSASARRSATEITLFKSVGNAAQDLAAASRILANATRLGLGTKVRL